jgi:hypothetical protein
MDRWLRSAPDWFWGSGVPSGFEGRQGWRPRPSRRHFPSDAHGRRAHLPRLIPILEAKHAPRRTIFPEPLAALLGREGPPGPSVPSSWIPLLDLPRGAWAWPVPPSGGFPVSGYAVAPPSVGSAGVPSTGERRGPGAYREASPHHCRVPPVADHLRGGDFAGRELGGVELHPGEGGRHAPRGGPRFRRSTRGAPGIRGRVLRRRSLGGLLPLPLVP